MKVNETAELDDTDPLLYTGPKQKKKGEKDDEEDDEDEDRHNVDEIPDEELATSPIGKMTKAAKKAPKPTMENLTEWVSVIENEFGDILGIDFGVTKEEAPDLKDQYSGLMVSDSYLGLISTTLAEDNQKGNSMANKKFLTEPLMEIGIKPKKEVVQEKRKEAQKVSSEVVQEIKEPEVTSKRHPDLPPPPAWCGTWQKKTVEENKKNNTSVNKAYLNPKKIW